jgi:hypothetical protein
MLRLIVILVIFAIFFVPARIIRVEDEKAISFQQERLPQMTREQSTTRVFFIRKQFTHSICYSEYCELFRSSS